MNKQQFLEAHEILITLQKEFEEEGMALNISLHRVPGRLALTQYHILKKESTGGLTYYVQQPNVKYDIFLDTPVNGGKILRPLQELLPDLPY